MAFGVYIHIPYCIQRCHYCDFTTFRQEQIMPPEDYISLVLQEIRLRAPKIPMKTIHSIYFGGGTPSLIDPQLILSLIHELTRQGFRQSEQCEITIEINPGTLNKEKLDAYINGGVNRFSVGAQSFNDKRLKACGREHRVEDTRLVLNLLKEKAKNFSLDLLFALPHQSMKELKDDLKEIQQIEPPHVSPYILTVPEAHPMALNRPTDDLQISMMCLIETELAEVGLCKYELSNFAKAKFESVHNNIYWSDESYWGLGLSAHSYMRASKTRFWNPKTWSEYIRYAKETWVGPHKDYSERLNEYEYGFDLVHTALRLSQGLSKEKLHGRLRNDVAHFFQETLTELENRGWTTSDDSTWRLTSEGQLLSNQVFSKLLPTGT